MEDYNIQASGSFSDKESVLRQIDPKATIEDLKLHFLGLRRETYRDGNVLREKIVRISKPMFTYEFVQNQLMLILNSKLNFVIQVSRFRDEEIRRRIRADDERLCLTLAEGKKYYISNKQWNRILELHDNVIENDEGIKQTYWQRNGMDWEYNKAVDNKMVEMTHEDNIDSGEMYAVLSQIRSAITSLTFASYNKSYADKDAINGMLVGMLGEIRKESSVVREAQQKKRSWLGSSNNGDVEK